MSIFGIGKLCKWKDQGQPRRMRKWTSHLFIQSPRRRFAGRHVDAQRRGGLNIDNLLHRQVGGVGALENAVEVPRRQTVRFGKINPIANALGA